MTTATADAEFLEQAEPYRRELIAHCYRMMGSHHDAEDLVQETMVRAWRGYEGYDRRASMRTWLHKIATNTCLTALGSSGRRPLPSGLGTDASDPRAPLLEDHEVPWLEPFAGDDTRSATADPAAVVTERESVRLAFIAALQHLPPRQRAVLILRDVLQWRAAEVADTLGITVATANSLLQRARTQLKDSERVQHSLVEPDSPTERELLRRYVDAFERYDVDGIVALFTDKAIWEMPPFTGWYQGPENIGELIRGNCPASAPGDQILLPTAANGQPAFGLYMRQGDDPVHYPFQLQVLDVTADGVAHVTVFFTDDMTALFERFGLPARPY
jgi:RNA polymerase sigma-70 factor (ECF subfamily)